MVVRLGGCLPLPRSTSVCAPEDDRRGALKPPTVRAMTTRAHSRDNPDATPRCLPRSRRTVSTFGWRIWDPCLTMRLRRFLRHAFNYRLYAL